MGRKPKSEQVVEEDHVESPKEFVTFGKAVGNIPIAEDKFLIFTVEICAETGKSRNFTVIKEVDSRHQALYDFKSTAIKNKLL